MRWQWHSQSRGGNVAGDDTTTGTDKVVDLTGRGASDGIGDTDTVDTDLVDGTVDGEQIDKIRSERVLRAETDLLALALDELDDFQSSVLDVGHVLAVAVLAEVAGGSDNDIETVNTSLDGDLGILEMTSHVGQDLSLELVRVLESATLREKRTRCVLTPSLQMASQSLLDCSEAAGLVSSMSANRVSFGICT
jgi:hypothetical protein